MHAVGLWRNRGFAQVSGLLAAVAEAEFVGGDGADVAVVVDVVELAFMDGMDLDDFKDAVGMETAFDLKLLLTHCGVEEHSDHRIVSGEKIIFFFESFDSEAHL